ncbi:MAG TPA: hypothetical protein VIV58_16295 [Kofleriaceae bacterium]
MIGLLASAVIVASNGEEVTAVTAPDADHKISELAKPAAPYLAARVYWTGESEMTPDGNECHLAIETKRGWTVASLDTDCWRNGRYYRRLAVQELAVKSSTLWLRYQFVSSDPDEAGTEQADYLVICGLADGAPRCTAAIEIAYAFDGKPKWRVKPALKAGALVLSLEKGKRAALPAETAGLLGKSSLSFQ